MTAGEAIRMADELRPNNSFSDEMKQLWLRQADSGLRRNVVERSDTGSDFEGRGADILWEEGLEYDTPLLADGAAEAQLAGGADGPRPRRDSPGGERIAALHELCAGVCGVGEAKLYAGRRREADDVNERALERGRTSPSRLTACHLPYRGEALAGRATLNWIPEV